MKNHEKINAVVEWLSKNEIEKEEAIYWIENPRPRTCPCYNNESLRIKAGDSSGFCQNVCAILFPYTQKDKDEGFTIYCPCNRMWRNCINYKHFTNMINALYKRIK